MPSRYSTSRPPPKRGGSRQGPGPAVRQPPAGLRYAREHVEEGAAHLHPALGGVEHSVQPQLIVKDHVDGRAGVDDQHDFRVERTQVAQLGAGYVVGAPFRRAVGALAGLTHEDIDGGVHALRHVLGRDLPSLRRDEGVLPGHVRLPRQRHAADEFRHLPLPAAARGGHALVVVVEPEPRAHRPAPGEEALFGGDAPAGVRVAAARAAEARVPHARAVERRPAAGERQRAVIFQQHHALRGHAPRQRAVGALPRGLLRARRCEYLPFHANSPFRRPHAPLCPPRRRAVYSLRPP